MTYRQQWSARIQLEAACHEASVFFTLTYSDDFLPDPPQLQPKDLQLFLKRLRNNLRPVRFRFFACGEYGSKSLRPHYHGVLFGVGLSHELETIINRSWSVDGVSIGFIEVAELNPARAAYVAKYVCKGVSEDEKVPEGWQEEFARMSNRPGIGAGYATMMAQSINKANDHQVDRGYPLITELLGGSMRIGPFYYPVARYLREKVKEAVKDQPSELHAALERDKGFVRELREPTPKLPTKVSQLILRRKLRQSSGVL